MTEMIQVHRGLGLTDADDEDVSKEMMDLLKDTERITDALDVLTAKYDARTLLIGMRMMQMIHLNAGHKQEEQAFNEAFGQRQNAGQN